MPVLAQIVGGVGIVANIIILQQKTRRGLLISKLIADVIWFLHYVLLGAFSGAGICIVAVFRELIFMHRRSKKWANHIIWPIIFALAAIVSSVITWKGPISLLPAFASVVSVIGYWIGIPRISRIIVFPSAGAMVTYDIVCGSVTGIINECFGLASAIVGIIRLDIKKKKSMEDRTDNDKK